MKYRRQDHTVSFIFSVGLCSFFSLSPFLPSFPPFLLPAFLLPVSFFFLSFQTCLQKVERVGPSAGMEGTGCDSGGGRDEREDCRRQGDNWRRSGPKCRAGSQGREAITCPLKRVEGASVAVDTGTRTWMLTLPGPSGLQEVSFVLRPSLMISALGRPAFRPLPGAGHLPQISLSCWPNEGPRYSGYHQMSRKVLVLTWTSGPAGAPWSGCQPS